MFEPRYDLAVPVTHWTTRDGTRVAIAHMTDVHLQNTIGWIERQLEELNEEEISAYGFASSCRGDMASYYAGHAAEESSDRAIAAHSLAQPTLEAMRAELKRRGLAAT